MKHEEFLYGMTNPAPAAKLDIYPKGGIMQGWAESPELYSAAFGHHDDVHRFTAGHTGLDIVAYHRAPIVAAHDGFVSDMRTERVGLGGLVVWLRSPVLDFKTMGDSYITTGYGHLDEIVVKMNQTVKKGELIGYMGNTGFVVSGGTPYWGNAPAGKGTHLHFSLYEYILKNGAFQPRFNNLMQNTTDSLPYLTRNPVGLITALKNILRFLTSRSN